MNTIKFQKKNTLVIAHRGLSGIETENTNSAFVAAGNRSYYGIETDIYKTADGHFVINHDDNFNRVAGRDIFIENSTLEQIQDIILFDKDKTKNRIDLHPSILENYISICKKYEKHCVLELKSNFTFDDVSKIIEIIKSFDYLENVTFISFNYDNLLKVRKILPNHPVQYLFFDFNDEIEANLIRDKIDIDVRYYALTKEKIEKFHNVGLKVNCWTVDSKEDAEKLVEYGIDFITTNILE